MSSKLLVLALCGILASLACAQTQSSDLRTAQQKRAVVAAEDFLINFQDINATGTAAGNSRTSFINNNPALEGTNVGQGLITLEACGINQPHVHPRGTEAAYVTEGELFFQFVEENGGRVISANVTQGETFVIPQGLLHFGLNRGCQRAQFLATFPTSDPGTQTLWSNLMRLDDAALAATTGLTTEQIDNLQATTVFPNPSRQDAECLARCGLAQPASTSNSGRRML